MIILSYKIQYSITMNKDSKEIDYTLLFLVIFLVLFWSIMISSASVYDSQRIYKNLLEKWLSSEPNNWRFAIRNIIQAIIWFTCMIIAIKLPFQFWEKQTRNIHIWIIVLLILVLIFWEKINGSRWWFDIPWIPFSLQPTEFLKLWIILISAHFCNRYSSILSSNKYWFLPFLATIFIPCFLVFLQPDFWALLIIMPVAMSIFFIAGWSIRILFLSVLVWILATSFLYINGKYEDPADRTRFSYIYDRLNSNFQSKKDSLINNTMHHQNKQALIAIWSGWWFWLWFGDSIQKYWYLPEPHWDFIFSIIVEELWFLWSLFIIFLYLFIIYRWFMISHLCANNFWKYVAFGITILIFWQVIVNISVNLSIFPNTGLTLPFVSYWWSSLLIMLLSIGILLSISRSVTFKKNAFFRMWIMSFFNKSTRYIKNN